MPKFVSKTYTKDSPADHNYANDLELRIADAIDPIVDEVNSITSITTSVLRLSGGWTGQVKITKDFSGLVSLDGQITAGNTAIGTVVGTILEGFRVPEITDIVVMSYKTTSTPIQIVRLLPNGQCVLILTSSGENLKFSNQYRI